MSTKGYYFYLMDPCPKNVEQANKQIRYHQKSCTKEIPKRAPSFYNQRGLNFSIKRFYQKRIKELGPFYLGSYDTFLISLFSGNKNSEIEAHKYISANQDKVLSILICQNNFYIWENRKVLRELQHRAYQLKLRSSEKVNHKTIKKIALHITQTLNARQSMIQ